MVDNTIVPVILSGGSGTRLWPMSRPERPKQFLSLTAAETMLQLTAARATGEGFAAPIVVANNAHANEVANQLFQAGCTPQAIVLEPVARNTAPAIALAAIAAGAGEAPLLVMPSDHVIADVAAFHASIEHALPLVNSGWLITFGIQPKGPETGYGYIQVGDALSEGVHRVERFVEKPPLETARAMVAAGDHVWNGGIFMFRADAYLAALAKFAPGMLDASQRSMDEAENDGVCIRPASVAFESSPSDSIDYAVMERAAKVAVVPVSMGWSDVGSWDALHALSDLDQADNASDGGAIMVETRGCLVRSDHARVAMVGVENLIVVSSGNDILILPRGRSQEVKRILEAIKSKN